MMIWCETETDGISVTVPNRDALLSDLSQRMRDRRGFSVATLNLDHVVKLRRDGAFRAAYKAQTHITADGNPIVWLSRLARQSDVTLIPGSELIAPIAELAARHGVPVALFGSTDTSLRAAAEQLEARFPELRVVLTLAPPMGFDPDGPEADAAIARIGDSGARLVFLAIGAPKQEQFAARAQTVLSDTGFLSIGAGLDFISGKQKRAPAWIRAIATEWLWRMLSDPKRLAARYGACARLLPSLTLRALSSRRTEHRA